MAKPGDIVVVNGQKLKVDNNGLRAPSNREKLNGLPKSAEAAAKAGLNMYTKDGVTYVMRYKSRKKEGTVVKGKKIEVERHDARTANRFGTSGNKNKRGDAERIASPDPKVRSAANKRMAELSSKGRVGHHGLLVSSYAKGKAEAIAKGGPKAGELFDKRYGLKGGAHSVKNIYDVTHKQHDQIHNKQEPEYFNSIKKAGTQYDQIMRNLKKLLKINGTNGTNGTNGKSTNGRTLKINGGFGKDFDYKNTNYSDRPSETSMPRFNLPGKVMTPDGVVWPLA